MTVSHTHKKKKYEGISRQFSIQCESELPTAYLWYRILILIYAICIEYAYSIFDTKVKKF